MLFLFGLTNAGVQLNGIGALTVTVVAALMVGKTLGIGLSTLFAVKVMKIPLPKGMGMREIWLLGFIASIGLTVALFVAGQAFRTDNVLMAEAKMGALLSVAAGIVSIALAKTFPDAFITKTVGDANDGDAEDEVYEEDEDDDDEELDDVIVHSMINVLHDMRRNVNSIEERTGVNRKGLIKRYNHAKKRIIASKLKQQRADERALKTANKVRRVDEMFWCASVWYTLPCDTAFGTRAFGTHTHLPPPLPLRTNCLSSTDLIACQVDQEYPFPHVYPGADIVAVPVGELRKGWHHRHDGRVTDTHGHPGRRAPVVSHDGCYWSCRLGAERPSHCQPQQKHHRPGGRRP